VSGQRHAPAAFGPGKRPPSHILQEAGWAPELVCTQDVRGKILRPCRGYNPDRPVVQSVVRHYTDWATPASIIKDCGHFGVSLPSGTPYTEIRPTPLCLVSARVCTLDMVATIRDSVERNNLTCYRQAGNKGDRYSFYSVVSSTPRPCFTPANGSPVFNLQEAGWASELDWTQSLKEKYFASPGIKPRSSSLQSDTVLSELPQLLPYSVIGFVLNKASGG
jgi:hypothetical protein